MKSISVKSLLTGVAAMCLAGPAAADQVIADDLIVNGGSLCVGLDCVNGESFGFDTLRLKENNTRIKFDDTSASASFPNNDWQLTANDSANGGLNKFSIDDVTGSKVPFLIEAGAPTNALYVDSSGNIGFGRQNPVVELHSVNGDTPTLRLEQDGSSGFGAQTWDVAGNETNFFVRDVTNGSQLPFKIRPGADSNSLVLDVDNDVGIGTLNPSAPLHVRRTDGTAAMLIEEASGTEAARELLTLTNNGQVGMVLTDTSVAAGSNTGREWKIQNVGGELRLTTAPGLNDLELSLNAAGDLSIQGNFISNGTQLNVPDYVFEEDYALRPLSEVQSFIDTNGHLPDVPSAAQIAANGINHSEMQMTLLRKIEELTLYTLAMNAELQELRGRP